MVIIFPPNGHSNVTSYLQKSFGTAIENIINMLSAPWDIYDRSKCAAQNLRGNGPNMHAISLLSTYHWHYIDITWASGIVKSPATRLIVHQRDQPNDNKPKVSLYRPFLHYDDVILGTIRSQITSLTIVYSIIYSDADQRKHQSSASLAFVRGIHRGPVNSPHKWPVTRKMCPFDDVIMESNPPAFCRVGNMIMYVRTPLTLFVRLCVMCLRVV